MKIAKDLPQLDQEPKQPKKPYIAPRLTTYGDVDELTRGATGTLRTDGTSEPVKVN